MNRPGESQNAGIGRQRPLACGYGPETAGPGSIRRAFDTWDVSREITTSSSVRDVDGVVDRLLYWLLLDGNRLHVALAMLVGVCLLLFAGIYGGVLAVGGDSVAATVYGSGLVSGTLTLTTIALSVNQLILSRVFGSPNEYLDRLSGTRDLRERVVEHTDDHALPNDPAGFLSALSGALVDHAERLGEELEAGDWDPPEGVEAYVDDLVAYGESIDSKLERQTSIVDALAVILGTEYATNLTATTRVRGRHGDALSESADEQLDAVEDLLEAVAVTRQFFKTLSLQQDFARLSRVLAYSGLVAVVVSFGLTLVYRTGSVTIPDPYLSPVIAVGSTVVLAPLTVFIAYILRAATIAHETVSVGPFVPPEGQDG
ncbi:hypothetical protein [Halorarius halobius]|uniref:hypothetical protein n=1 Tax=Halorarius halobius TaxID=2962671 RepID=UPI0020CEBC8B|nr:hypothetical protein [Halorarius halobius]